MGKVSGGGGVEEVRRCDQEWIVFVDNFSQKVSRLSLRELSNHHGKVMRVFIPLVNTKSKYKFTNFTFVTMGCRRDMERVIRNLNRSRIDGFVVRVSQAKFPRVKQTKGFHNGVREASESAGELSPFQVCDTTGAIAKEKSTVFFGHKTFKDALLSVPVKKVSGDNNHETPSSRNGTSTGPNLLDFKVPANELEWLDRSLLHDGIEVKIRNWGVDFDSFVIVFKSKAEMEETWRSKRDELCYWFSHIGPLMLNGVPNYFCSILLVGVPLYYWHKSFFESLGNRWGSLVEVDIGTLHRKRLDVARITIRVASPLSIPESFNVVSMGVSYLIKVKLGKLSDECVHPVPGNLKETFANEWPTSDEALLVSKEGVSEGGIPVPVVAPPSSIGTVSPDIDPHSQGCLDSPNEEFKDNWEPPLIPIYTCGSNGNENMVQVDSWWEDSDTDVPVDLDSASGPLALMGSGSNGPVVNETCDMLNTLVTHSEAGIITPVNLESIDPPGVVRSNQNSVDSMQMVPDSFEDLGKEGSGRLSSFESQQNPYFLTKYAFPKGIFRASNKRILRRLACDSLEDARENLGEVDISLNPQPANHVVGLEAESIWEISNLLEISFKGGRGTVIKTKLEVFSVFEIRRLWSSSVLDYALSPSIGSAGGLLSMWDTDYFQVDEKIIRPRFIVLIGCIKHKNFTCGILNVYGPTVEAEKGDFLGDLLALIRQKQIPWCLAGDFNLFLDPCEKNGRSLILSSIAIFRTFIFEASLIDLPLIGGKYTWGNNRDEPTFVRLDRFLLSSDFEETFPNIVQKLLNKSLSDHNAILLCEEVINWGPKPFRVFNFWCNEKGYDDTVFSAIRGLKLKKPRIKIGGLLKGTKSALKSWVVETNQKNNGVTVVQMEQEITDLETKIQLGLASDDTFSALYNLRTKLWSVYRKEECKWLQKSRLCWMGRSEGAVDISHIQFAYDLLIFCGGEERQVRNVKRVLRIFELASGLKLNFKKSKVFGINLSEDSLKNWAVGGDDNEKSRIHWINWTQVCMLLLCGGLGVANLEIMNRSLLGKWFWHFGNEASSLWKRVIIAKIPRTSTTLLPYKVPRRSTSWVWKVIWTVWLFRNDVIFKGKDVDWIQVDFLVKFRIASWLLAKFPNDSISVESLMADFSLAINLIHYVNRGNSKSGIGGLLKDDSGMILMEFSEASSLSLPALVELEAINFGISYFLTTSWSLTHRLIFESDCKMVVDWINGMIEPPITVANKVIETAKLMFAKSMCLTLIPRCCNVLADTLAKQGIS
ncbi:hypothetical protein GQ457_10G009920 [Hibiscus cannabinus]